MNILLTGSTGNIGSHLKKHLENIGHKVVGLSRTEPPPNLKYDLNHISDEEINKLIRENNIELIIHLAAILRPTSLDDMLFNSNVITKFLNNEICRKLKYIVIGSVAEYGLVEAKTLSETSTIPKPKSIYGISKLIQSCLCEHCVKTFDIDIKAFRLFNIITPEMPISSFWGSIINATKSPEKEKITINDLKIERDFIDIRDFCSLISNAITLNNTGNIIYNAGSGKNHSYGEVLEILREILEDNNIKFPEVTIEHKVERYNTAFCDLNLVKKDIAWEPKYSIRDSLEWCLKSNKII